MKIKPFDFVKAWGMIETQKEVEVEIIQKVWKAIDVLGIRDKVYDVAMQGSYAKGTDLPSSGSDLDLFVIFNTDVSLKEREAMGLGIGSLALQGKNPQIKDATSKYVEAYFTYKGHEMEVQIVPTRHLTLEQIRMKKVDGETISIGMERTVYHTKFMQENLKNGMKGEVRILKQFMKDNGLYDSSMKSQGFSGYATECLIYYLGSFEKVVEYFANFKVGDKIGEGVRNEDNIFSLMDPIDPNRDLITAFSPLKIGRTVKVMQYYLKHGEPPTRTPATESDSVTISYTTTQDNEDTLMGQLRKTQKSIISQMKNMGFTIPSRTEKITDEFEIEISRVSSNRNGNIISLTFGVKELIIPSQYLDTGVPVDMKDAVENYRKANEGKKFIIEDGRVKAIKRRQFMHFADALKYLVNSGTNLLQKTGVTNDMKNGVTVDVGKSKFENII